MVVGVVVVLVRLWHAVIVVKWKHIETGTIEKWNEKQQGWRYYYDIVITITTV